jgi:hypothetical protein
MASAPGKQQLLAARPMRLVQATAKEVSPTKYHLTVPMRPAKLASLLLRLPRKVTRTFELDPMGVFVWEACDGKTAVRQVIRRLARQYHLNDREAEVATVTFLNTLAKRGLIGLTQ